MVTSLNESEVEKSEAQPLGLGISLRVASKIQYFPIVEAVPHSNRASGDLVFTSTSIAGFNALTRYPRVN